MEYVNKDLYDEIAANSNIVTGDQYRQLVCGIAQVASDMVVKTLGPYGYTTVIDDGAGFTYPSKDGWTCLSKMQFTDPTYNTIYNTLKKISFNSNTTVGDGTTSAMVTANNFLKEVYMNLIPKLEQSGKPFRQASFIESMLWIEKALERALRANVNVHRVDPEGDFSDIRKIAYIATNGNDNFADIIQKVYQETKNPNIQITLDGNAAETTYSIQRGYKFNARTLNFPIYVNDESGSIVHKNSPRRVVIFDHNVTYQMHEKIIGAIAGIAARDNTEILIMAPYFDDIISSLIDAQVKRLVQNRQIPNITLIQIPNTLSIHRKTLSDLAVLTACHVFDEAMVRSFNILYHNQTHEEQDLVDDKMLAVQMEEYGFKSPEDVVRICLGHVKSIIIDKTEAFLQDYEDVVNPTLYQALMTEVTKEYQDAKKTADKTIGGTLDKDFLFTQLRYIKLTGSTGVIKVGALTDVQQRTDKDTIDDAVLACKSAFEHGYVRGMNLEILSILNTWIKSNDSPNLEYYEDILQTLYNSFYQTSMAVLNNKHPENDQRRLVKVVDQDPKPGLVYPTMNLSNNDILNMAINNNATFDYNLRAESLETPEMWSVVNSTDTDVEILRAVVNVLTTVITSNQYLSQTNRYDRKSNDEFTLQKHLREDYRITQNKANAFMNALAENENYDLLQGLIGGIHVDGELLEVDSDDESENETISQIDHNANIEKMFTPKSIHLTSENHEK